MSAEVAAALRRAKALIDTPEKWIKGHFRLPVSDACGCAVGMRYCATGAIIEATPVIYGDADSRLRAQTLDALTVVVTAQHPHFYSYTPAHWNDEQQRTHADVMAAFDAAIAREEADDPDAHDLHRSHSEVVGRTK